MPDRSVHRTRAYRDRKKIGVSVASIAIGPELKAALVEFNFLSAADIDDRAAIEQATQAALRDWLGVTRHRETHAESRG
jgi:hypothetical protein